MKTEQVLIFDCDGVILDSNEMKSAGFAKVVADYPESATAPFLAYQKTAFGTSRFRMVTEFFDHYLGRPPEDGEKERLLSAFGDYCRQAYPRQQVTPGARELFNALHEQAATLYIASGSAEDELRDALAEIGIAPYFAGIYGSPRPKKDILLKLRARHPAANMVFFGDAKADYEAAKVAGLPFVYVSAFAADPDGMAALKAEVGFRSITTLQDFDPASLLKDPT